MTARFDRLAGAFWQVTAIVHADCPACDREADSAAILARVTGSVGGTNTTTRAVVAGGDLVPEHGATVRRVADVAVTDPDDLDAVDPPLWEGDPADAASHLRPRSYRATATVRLTPQTTDTVPIILTVHPSGAVLLTDGSLS